MSKMRCEEKKLIVIYSEITLHIFDDKFIFEVKNQNTKQNLQITRQSPFTITQIEKCEFNSTKRKQILGILGIIKLQAGPYLVTITRRELIGTIKGNLIYRILKVKIIPFFDTLLTDRQKKDETTYLSIIESLLSDKYFYFSYTFNLLTNFVQSTNYYQKNAHFNTQIYSNNQSKYFFWNKKMLNSFLSSKVENNWILPVIRGFVHITTFSNDNLTLDFILISRRSRFKAGTRYLSRGVDEKGRVANYVETEQLIGFNGSFFSFVQTRGSIPLFWSQQSHYLKYNPRALISRSFSETMKAFTNHFDRELNLYSRQIIVNLLDKKGDELRLSEGFSSYLENYNKPNHIEYYEFDFHAECKNDQFDNVFLLIDKLNDTLYAIAFTEINAENEVEYLQFGSIRTNCLDCLDRTNLVQSTFARRSLSFQLRHIGINENDFDASLDRTFKEAWANNGDAISTQYAGTGALKSDFTRTGKRNVKGKIKDGVNAMSRYVINNFHDNLRQIAMDLVLECVKVESIDMSMMEERKEEDVKEEIKEEFGRPRVRMIGFDDNTQFTSHISFQFEMPAKPPTS